MDYKLIRSTVLICSVSILVILGLVLYANQVGVKKETASEMTARGQEVTTPDGQNEALHADETQNHVTALNGDVRAFLYDDTFWDADPEGEQTQSAQDAVRLSLVATSIQKDLRLQIVDGNGELVTGEPFYVTVEDVGQFKDLDQDGIIYVGDLSPGDYNVSIDPIEGYHVAASLTKVHVKEKVEYRAIEDIDLFILSEAEIDTGKDAVTSHNLNGDVDDTERTGSYNDLDTAVMGIDVSSWNGEIDWEAVRESGIEFAIIRCGYRGYTTGSLVEDKCFWRNITAANAAGVKVGLYFFTQAINEVEAVEEASMVITLCRDYQVDLPIFIDTESTGGNGRADGLDKTTRTTVCRAFCETIESAGYHAGVYASKNWFNQMLQAQELAKYITWLAEYKETPTYGGDYQFWQYTSNGWINGITGRVDLNIGNLSLANIRESGITNDTDDTQTQAEAEPVPEMENTENTVQGENQNGEN